MLGCTLRLARARRRGIASLLQLRGLLLGGAHTSVIVIRHMICDQDSPHRPYNARATARHGPSQKPSQAVPKPCGSHVLMIHSCRAVSTGSCAVLTPCRRLSRCCNMPDHRPVQAGTCWYTTMTMDLRGHDCGRFVLQWSGGAVKEGANVGPRSRVCAWCVRTENNSPKLTALSSRLAGGVCRREDSCSAVST